MEIKKGDALDNIQLPTSNGKIFNTMDLKGKKVLLTFYRFASCPMCNVRLNTFVRRYEEFNKDFAKVAIFHSSVNNLKHFTDRHNAPFAILADEHYSYFKKYDVKRSFLVFLLSQITRGLKIWMAMFRGFIPYRIKGYMGILPVDILINKDGIVEAVKYGKDIADHMNFEDVKLFANSWVI